MKNKYNKDKKAMDEKFERLSELVKQQEARNRQLQTSIKTKQDENRLTLEQFMREKDLTEKKFKE